MLKQIQKKIILTNVIIVSILLFSLTAFMVFQTYSDLKNSIEFSLRQSLEDVDNSGEHSTPIIGFNPDNNEDKDNRNDRKKPFAHRIAGLLIGDEYNRELTRAVLVVKYNSDDGTTQEVISNASMNDETLDTAVKLVCSRDNETGILHDLGLYYCKSAVDETTTISFADYTQVQSYMLKLLLQYTLLCLAALIVMIIISFFISMLAVRPLKKSLEQEKRFVADVSHELKTPLTVILANNTIIKSHKDKSVSDEMQWIDSTQEEAEHMNSLIKSMLNLALIESGSSKESFEDVNFSSILQKCIMQLEGVAFEREITFDSDIENDIIVKGDSTQLNELIIILLDNAIKYASDKSVIKTTLNRKHSCMEFSVNSQSYINEDDIPHIFERFYRVDKTRNSSSSSSYGLGLAIANSLVTNHNGNISVKSSKESGTTFVVTIKTK